MKGKGTHEKDGVELIPSIESARQKSLKKLVIINEVQNEAGGSSKASSGPRNCDIHDTELDDILPTPF